MIAEDGCGVVRGDGVLLIDQPAKSFTARWSREHRYATSVMRILRAKGRLPSFRAARGSG
jgi:hypothetical protein